jgi:hypothetical protein
MAVFIVKLMVAQLDRELLNLLWNPNIHYRDQKSPPLEIILKIVDPPLHLIS